MKEESAANTEAVTATPSLITASCVDRLQTLFCNTVSLLLEKVITDM